MDRKRKSPGIFAILDSANLPYTDDDALLPRTPDDIVAVLGVDPLHLFDEQSEETEQKGNP